MKSFLAEFFLVLILMGMGFIIGAVYQQGRTRTPQAPVADLLKCVKVGEDAIATLDLCIDRQSTFIQIIDDQSEIINSMGDIIWDMPFKDLNALRLEPKPKKLQKFGAITQPSFPAPDVRPMEPAPVPDTVEDILKGKKPAVLPWDISPGTIPPLGPLY